MSPHLRLRPSHRLWLRLCSASLVTAPTLAAAQAPGSAVSGKARKPSAADKSRAAALYGEGVGLFKAEKFAEAAEKFSAAFALDPAPALLYNLARACELNGDAEEAVRHYREYLRRYPTAEDRAAVENKARVLEAVLRKARQGRLVLSGVPAGARIYVDGGAPLEAAGPEGWALDPGERQVRVEPLDGEIWIAKVSIATGQTTRAEYLGGAARATPPKPPKGVDPPADPEQTPPPAAGGGPSTRAILGWTGVGAGAVMLGLGGVFFAQAVSAVDDYDAVRKRLAAGELLEPGARAAAQADAQDAIDTQGTLAYVMWGLGAAALGTGVVLLVLDRNARAEPTGLRVTPTFGGAEGPTGIGLTGTF